MPSSQAGGRDRFLQQTLATLWPPPARVSRYRPWNRPVKDGAEATEFVVVPNERHAALLLPRRSRRAAAAALRNYKASASTWDRRKLDTLAVGARCGLADLLPHRVRIARGADGDDLGSYLSAMLGQPLVLSLHIGPPRANRKPVLQALTPEGACVGFVKVGVDPLTRRLVRAEAAALAFLERAALAQVQSPRLLLHGQWRDHEVLAQQALPRGERAADLARLSAAMAELAQVRGVTAIPAAASPYWQGLRRRLSALQQRDVAAALRRFLDRAEAGAGATVLRFGSWHGDWAPWNMTMSQGRALVWDWERFETGVPVGYDAVHYAVQHASRSRAADLAAEMMLAAAPRVLGPVGVNREAAGLVATLYLIEIGTRYLHEGQAEAGAWRGRVDKWLLPVLARHQAQAGPSAAPGRGACLNR